MFKEMQVLESIVGTHLKLFCISIYHRLPTIDCDKFEWRYIYIRFNARLNTLTTDQRLGVVELINIYIFVFTYIGYIYIYIYIHVQSMRIFAM
jgi:hypothetical protein